MYIKKILVGGSAANPPHVGHLAMIKLLINNVPDADTKIIWIPSGIRSDKPGLIPANHRKQMTKLLVTQIDDPRFKVDFTDLDAGDNRSTIQILDELQEKYPDAKVIWYTGVDSVVPLEKYNCLGEIEARWTQGKKLMENYNFLILPRPHYPNPQTLVLPTQFEVLNYKIKDSNLLDRSSSEIVNLIQTGKPWEHLYGGPDNQIVRYIKKHNLYK